MNQTDRLQERLARLEAGESLEACLAGLSDEEAELLRTAANLRSIQFPNRSAESIAAQRTDVLYAAREGGRKTRTRRSSSVSRWKWPQVLTEMRGLAALAAISVLVIVAISILVQPPSLVEQDVAQAPTPTLAPSPSAVPDTGVAQVPATAPTAPLAVAYIPFINSVISAPDPQSAILSNTRGIVEVSTGDDTWAPVKAGEMLHAGQRVRTQKLSSATLRYFDGSQTRLGASTELSIDNLNARDDGARTVLLTQLVGESDHEVQTSRFAASRYEVRTPSGSGAARGTSFHVSVSTSLVTRISVNEGSVAATNLNVTVIIIAGQVTTIHSDEPPQQPFFRVSGEGIVTQTGETWRIGNLEFVTDETTVIIGNPQVGDLVAVDGHVLSDGTRVADLIVLLQRAPENLFSFVGIVESISETEWTISGRAVAINEDTLIEAGIEVGDLVEIEGIVEDDGSMLAVRVHLIDDAVGFPFAFVGLVESIEDEVWTISGVSIAIDADTEIDAGLEVGDIVSVRGRILDDGTWLADSIRIFEEPERRFEFSGTIQSIDPWIVSGIAFETDSQTEIEEGLQVGNRVKVEGRVREDGTWLADEIKLFDERPRRFEFTGRVTSIDPWIVGGLAIEVDDQTEIKDDISVGDIVEVEGRILSDGTLLAEEIKLLHDHVVCVDITAVIVSHDSERIVLSSGEIIELTDEVEISGDLRASAVVIIHICISADGTITVVSVTIIYQPLPTPTPPPPPPPPGDDDDDDDDGDAGSKVTVCHIPSGNPSEAHTITIGRSAWENEHRNHGDTLGPCD